jgi:hypothetical protein
VGGVSHDEASFPHRSVPDHDALHRLHCAVES